MKYELMESGIAKISFDNGKVNAISKELSEELVEALNRAEAEAKAVVLCGNSGIFTAGFDLRVVEQGIDVAKEMFLAGFALLEKIYSHPQPVIAACEGHAIGMGVFILLASDYRIGAEGNFQFKLPETEIGLAFSPILKILAKEHIDIRHHNQAIIQSRAYPPTEASNIGILDEVCEPANVHEKAIQKALELIKFPPTQYKINKLNIRSETIKLISESRGL